MDTSQPAEAEVRRILVKRAKKRELITYLELTSLIRTSELVPNSKHLAALLTSVSCSERAAGRGLLSAIVVRKIKTGYGLPGIGFFSKFAGVKRKDFRNFWQKERDKVFRAWRRKD